MGFRDIVIGQNIIDDTKISLLCDDGEEYVFFLENGKITEDSFNKSIIKIEHFY